MVSVKRSTKQKRARFKKIIAFASIGVAVLLVAQVCILRYELDNLKKFSDDLVLAQANARFSSDYVRLSPVGLNDAMTIPELELTTRGDKTLLNSVRYRPTVATDTLQAALVTDTEYVYGYKFGNCLNLYTIEVHAKDTKDQTVRNPLFMKQLADGRTMKVFDNTMPCGKEYSKEPAGRVLNFIKTLESF